MLNGDDLQKAIIIAAKGGLGPVVRHEAFQHTSEGWIPRSGCLWLVILQEKPWSVLFCSVSTSKCTGYHHM